MKRSKFGAYLRHAVMHTFMEALLLFAAGVLMGVFVYQSRRAIIVVLLSIALYAAIAYNLSRHPAFKTRKQLDDYFYYVSDISKHQLLAAIGIYVVATIMSIVLWYLPTIRVSDNYPNAIHNMQEEFQISSLMLSLLHGMPGSTTQLYYAAAEAADVETEDALESIAQVVNSYRIYTYLLIPSVFICGWFFGIINRYGIYKRLLHKMEVSE